MDKVLIICGIIITVGSALTYMIKFAIKPIRDYIKIQHEKEKEIKVLQDNSTKVNEILVKQNATDQILCTCMLAILQNLITGNSIDNLKKTRDEMQAYLIKK